MKAILFCLKPYAFGILKPLHDELHRQGHEVLWYVPERFLREFPFAGGSPVTASIAELHAYRADAIFVPGNDVPHYLRGVKVQVFHGLAGEKKSHFRIRGYFDLYLTQGPYFTRGFERLARRHRDFEVRETGWCKLDPLHSEREQRRAERNALLARVGRRALVLYAPTFSKALTSAPAVREYLPELTDANGIHLLVKFHDLMDLAVVADYRRLAETHPHIELVEDRNILRVLGMADLLVSDTSSVVYEFILLDRPVVTIRSRSPHVSWRDLRTAGELPGAVGEELREDRHREERRAIMAQYHPYTDGRSSVRMIAAVKDYIARRGVPETRRLNPYRAYRMNKKYGGCPSPGEPRPGA